eukprot:4263460-Prymnesium_polylepis.1
MAAVARKAPIANGDGVARLQSLRLQQPAVKALATLDLVGANPLEPRVLGGAEMLTEAAAGGRESAKGVEPRHRRERLLGGTHLGVGREQVGQRLPGRLVERPADPVDKVEVALAATLLLCDEPLDRPDALLHLPRRRAPLRGLRLSAVLLFARLLLLFFSLFLLVLLVLVRRVIDHTLALRRSLGRSHLLALVLARALLALGLVCGGARLNGLAVRHHVESTAVTVRADGVALIAAEVELAQLDQPHLRRLAAPRAA